MQPSASNSTEVRHFHHAPDANGGAKIKSLTWYFFQMFIAMAIGHALYQIAFVNLLAPVVLLTVLVLAGLVSLVTLKGLGVPLMTLGMALYMVLHRK